MSFSERLAQKVTATSRNQMHYPIRAFVKSGGGVISVFKPSAKILLKKNVHYQFSRAKQGDGQ
jgi:hypothetical protein